jgi:hypothetical protein
MLGSWPRRRGRICADMGGGRWPFEPKDSIERFSLGQDERSKDEPSALEVGAG